MAEKETESSAEFETRLRRRVLYFISPMLPVLGLLLEGAWYLRVGFQPRMILPLFCICFSFFVPVIARKVSTQAASMLMCALVLCIFFSVGLDFGLMTIQVVIWLPAIVLLIIFLLGRRRGLVFSILLALEAITIYLMVDIGPMVKLADHDDWVISLLAVILAFLSVVYFAILFLRVISYQQAELAEKNRFLQVLMGGISHDLRSPLATINMFSKMLIQKKDSNSLEKYLNKIVGVSENALKLTENLLEIAVYDQGLDNIHKEKVGMRAMVESVILECKPIASRKKIHLELTPGGEVFVLADSVRIKQVIINLITNAIKFSPQEKQVFVLLEQIDSALKVTVKDQGIGLDDKMKKLIFSEPSRTKRQGTEGEKSTGYGLLLCRYILELHESMLEVQSQPGEGSSFYFYLDITD